MPRRITIAQFQADFNIFDLSRSAGETLVTLVSEALRQPGSTAQKAILVVADGDFEGYRVTLTGTGLRFDAAGLLTGGTIAAISFHTDAGVLAGRITGPGSAGIGLAAAALVAPGADPAALFADWQTRYSAASVPGSLLPFVIGVTAETGSGADRLTGSVLADFLDGGAGHDLLRGGDGADQLRGDHVGPQINDTSQGRDTLYGGVGTDSLLGNGGNDRLYGGRDADVLRGDDIINSGNDLLYGGAGSDILTGGRGLDSLYGGAGDDRVEMQDAQDTTERFTINLLTGHTTGYGNDRLFSIEHATGGRWHRTEITGSGRANSLLGGERADTIRGGGGNDRIHAGGDADRVEGGAGHDLIGGGEGRDVLRGGAGRDTFVFEHAGAEDADRISDFRATDDTIYLTGAAMSGLFLSGALAASAFRRLGTGALDADDRILYNSRSGQVFLDSDGSGSDEAELLFTLSRGTALSHADFEVQPFFSIFSFY